MNRKISLVLGSGGARGLTQIGVINYLLENNYEIDEIVGCSIGSLIGAAFANGKIEALGSWMSDLTKMEVFRLMDFSNPKYGVLKGNRVLSTLQGVFPDIDIENLPIRYAAVATDLVNDEEVIFDKGSIYDAIRASIAIPAIFQGVKIDERLLVDGGVLNPLPTNLVAHNDNIIIAVNLEGNPLREENLGVANMTSVEILQESYRAMRRKLTQLSIELYPADYLLNIPHDISGIWDFDQSSKLIEIGYEWAAKTLAGPLKKKEVLQ